MSARRPLAALGLGLAVAGIHAGVPAGAADRVAPSYASADVDGDASEWGAGDGFGPLLGNDPPFEVRGQVSLRYDCDAGVLYVLAQAAPDVVFQTIDPAEAYVRLGPDGKLVSGTSGDDGVAPDFAWVGLDGEQATGFEASAPVEQGSYPGSLRVHAKVPDDSGDGYETIDLTPRYSDLEIACPTETEPVVPPTEPELPEEVTPPEEAAPVEEVMPPEEAAPVEEATPTEEVAPTEEASVPDEGAGPTVLARTGSTDAPLAATGLALVLAGLALRAAARRPRFEP